MSMTAASILERLPEPIRRDPKKSGILAALIVVMAVLGVRQFGGSSGPARAKAVSPVAQSAAVPTSATKSGTGNRVADNPVSGAAQRVADWLGTPIKALDRNLFETKVEYFQRIDSAVGDAAVVVAEELFWEQLAKSLAAQADQKKQKQIRSENLQLAASMLRLQSTLMGQSPRALIDGRMLRTGDSVEAGSPGMTVTFRVALIEARRVLVERDGVRVELRMDNSKARIVQE